MKYICIIYSIYNKKQKYRTKTKKHKSLLQSLQSLSVKVFSRVVTFAMLLMISDPLIFS